MNEDMTNTMKRLQEPFPAKDIEWRVQQSGGRDGNMWALPEAERGKQHTPSKNAGNAPQSATNTPDDKRPGQVPKRALSIEERRKNLVIAVQQKFGVSRGELKDMMGIDPESFNEDEINIIREAAKIAKVQNCDFKTAFNQVKQ